MTEFLSRKAIEEAAGWIRSRTGYHPRLGIVLGSGLGALAREVEKADTFPYGDIPHFPPSTVEGHAGRLVVGCLEGVEAMVMQGRAHYYEGYSMQQVTFPIRVMRALGVQTLFLTNAAGGLNPSFRPGDLMLITDHLNLVGMTGFNPLRGPCDPELGPRFLDMSQAYDSHLREVALKVARELGLPLHQGVYAMLAGPSYETPAEIHFLRLIGADAVGMSTVPEVIVARHGGMRVLGISGISNLAAGVGQKVSHEEVLEVSRVLAPRLSALLRGIIREIAPSL